MWLPLSVWLLWQNQQNKAQEAAKKVEEAKDKSKKDKSDKKDTFDREKLQQPAVRRLCWILQSAIRRPLILIKGYLDYDSASVNRDISAEVQQGTIPLFLQWDKRWGYEQYGDNFMAVKRLIFFGILRKEKVFPRKIHWNFSA